MVGEGGRGRVVGGRWYGEGARHCSNEGYRSDQ